MALLCIILGSVASMQAQAQSAASTIPQLTPFVYVPPMDGSPVVRMQATSVTYSPGKPIEKVVEPDLSLSYIYHYAFSGSILALNNGRTAPDGWYALTMVVLRTPTQEQKNWKALDLFASATEPMIVRVRNGAFSGVEVALKFNDLVPSVQITSLYIELIPLKDDCTGGPCVKEDGDGNPIPAPGLTLMPGYRPILAVVNQFIPFKQSNGAIPLTVPASQSPFGSQTALEFATRARDLVRKHINRNRKNAITPQQFALNNRLIYVSANDPSIQKASTYWSLTSGPSGIQSLQNIVNASGYVGESRLDLSYSNLMYLLCDRLAAANSAYRQSYSGFDNSVREVIRRCGDTAESRLRLSRVVHVGKVDLSRNMPYVMKPAQHTFSISANVVQAHSHSWDRGVGAAGALTALFRFTENVVPFSQAIASTVFMSTTQSDVRSRQVVLSASDSMDFDPMAKKIPTVNSTICLQVNIQAAPGSPFVNRDPRAPRGLYICGEPRRQLEVREVYAQAFSYSRDSGMLNSFDPEGQPINRSMRGDLQVSGFFWAMQKSLSPLDTALMPLQYSQAATSYFALTPSSAPLTVVTPLLFDGEMEPSMGGQLETMP